MDPKNNINFVAAKLTKHQKNNAIMTNQDKDFKWFKAHYAELVEAYDHCFVVIQNQKVVLSGDTFENAFTKAIEKGLELGSFIIQEVTGGQETYLQTFITNAIFA